MLIIFQRLISLPHDTSIMGSLGPLVPSSRSFKEKEMAAHSSILTWRIPWTEEPGRPTITGVARVRHHLAIKPSLPHSRGGTVER